MISKDRLCDLLVLLLLAGTGAFVRGCSSVPVEESRFVGMELPARLGEWSGTDMYFCHNELCLSELESGENLLFCPSCQSPLVRGWSLAEKRQLPPDTWLSRKKYRNPAGMTAVVTLVVSGMEQVSLHRPQICLAGQGFDMADQRTVEFRGGSARKLDVQLLEIYRRRRVAEGGLVQWGGYYVYWFTDGKHVTPYHLVRMGVAAFDRIFLGKARRWAYVAITGERLSDGRIPEESVRDLALRIDGYLKEAIPRGTYNNAHKE